MQASSPFVRQCIEAVHNKTESKGAVRGTGGQADFTILQWYGIFTFQFFFDLSNRKIRT